MPQRGNNLLLAQAGAVVAVDRQRDPATLVEMTSPGQRTVKRVEFLEQHPLLFQRRDRTGAGRAAEHAISHGSASFELVSGCLVGTVHLARCSRWNRVNL